MKALIAVAAIALTMFVLTAAASAATAPNAFGRWGVAKPNPQGFGVVQPNPRFWGTVERTLTSTVPHDARRFASSRPLGAVGRW